MGSSITVVVDGTSSTESYLSTQLAANPGTVNGQAVVITGRSAVGDGGEGVAVWSSTSTAASDNATVWGSGTGRWLRVWDRLTLNVKWFGAKGDDAVTDDTAAIQAAINAAIVVAGNGYETQGIVVKFPPGIYRLTSGLTWANANGLVLSGASPGATGLLYTGAASSTFDLISFDGINCRIENLVIRAGGGTIRSAITCTSGSPGGWISSTNTFADIVIGGYAIDQFLYGIRIVLGPAADNNNELHRFYRVHCNGYTQFAFFVEGGQAHGLWFEGCQMNGLEATGWALGGVHCYYGSYIHWNGGSGGYHRYADFFFQSFFQHSSIRGWNSEGSYALAKIGLATGAPFPLEISNCRFNSDYVPASEEVIHIATAGPTTIRCNVFETNGARAYIRNDGYSDTQNLIVQGNTFVSNIDYPQTLTDSVESGDTYYRRGCVKGRNPALWRITDLGNSYYESSAGAVVHRVLPSSIGLRGLTSTATTPGNLGGSVTFSSGESSKTVSFDVAEADTSYRVLPGIEVGTGSPVATVARASSKTTSGFTLTIDTAPTAGQTIIVNWLIFRS